jgi:hypothetical protein
MKKLENRIREIVPFYSGSFFSQSLMHPEDTDCWDFAWLVEELQSCLEAVPKPDSSRQQSTSSLQTLKDRIYTMFRLRSHVPLCCITRSGLLLNHLQLALEKDCNLATLAWACRGDVGQKELLNLDVETLLSWMIHQQNRKDAWKVTDIVMRLFLLLESGCNLESPVSTNTGTKSILRIILELVYSLKHEVAREMFVGCLIRLQLHALDQQRSLTMRPSLRYFLTGYGLPDRLGELPENETVGWTTVLHECVKVPMYNIVEALVLNGFEVSALDAHGETAFQCAITGVSTFKGHERDSFELDRIIALLRQSSMALRTPGDMDDKRWRDTSALPNGWDTIHVQRYFRERSTLLSQNKPTGTVVHNQELYLDRHFGSITLQRPTFSFFSDQRLALGFRKVHLPGQTYYLDLLRFIRPPFSLPTRGQAVEWIFTDAWYEEEAKQSDVFQPNTWRHFTKARRKRLKAIFHDTKATCVFVCQRALDVLLTVIENLLSVTKRVVQVLGAIYHGIISPALFILSKLMLFLFPPFIHSSST